MATITRSLSNLVSLSALALFGSGCLATADEMESFENEAVAEAESEILAAGGTCATFLDINKAHGVIPVSAASVPQTGLTVSVWFQTNNGSYSPLIGFGSQTAYKWDRALTVHLGHVRVSVYDANGTEKIVKSPAYSYGDNQWHHAAFTLGADGLKLYVDGSFADADASVTSSSFTAEQEIWLGRGYMGTERFLKGSVDDARVFNKVLTEAEIRGIMYQEIPGSTAGLFGSWRFNNPGSGTIIDESPNGRNGWLVGYGDGNAFWEYSLAPIYNDGATFDGVDDFISMGDKTALDEAITTKLTVEAWIYPTHAQQGVIVMNEGRYMVKRMADGSIRWGLANTSPGWSEQNSGLIAPLNAWSHVALVYDDAAQKAILYVNGKPSPAVSAWGAIGDYAPTLNDFRIGGRQACSPAPCTGGLFFGGHIDEVRVWNIARTGSQIQDAMFRQISGAESGLKGYWTLNEDWGSYFAYDSTVNKSTGAKTNAATAPVRSPLVDVDTMYYNGHGYIF
ncbi:MAG: LamG domain-containing protein, partial [Polyangiaceae bacterium]|nr:LamG domain-containing protein [Polyangiaceae bacterium]